MSVGFEVGGIFVGIGIMAVLGAIAYLFWQIARSTKCAVDIDERFSILKMVSIDNYAKEKGIDLEKEIAVRNVTKNLFSKKSFSRKVQEEVYESFFGKEKS